MSDKVENSDHKPPIRSKEELEKVSIFRYTAEERKLYLEPMFAEWEKEDEQDQKDIEEFDKRMEELSNKKDEQVDDNYKKLQQLFERVRRLEKYMGIED